MQSTPSANHLLTQDWALTITLLPPQSYWTLRQPCISEIIKLLFASVSSCKMEVKSCAQGHRANMRPPTKTGCQILETKSHFFLFFLSSLRCDILNIGEGLLSEQDRPLTFESKIRSGWGWEWKSGVSWCVRQERHWGRCTGTWGCGHLAL